MHLQKIEHNLQKQVSFQLIRSIFVGYPVTETVEHGNRSSSRLCFEPMRPTMSRRCIAMRANFYIVITSVFLLSVLDGSGISHLCKLPPTHQLIHQEASFVCLQVKNCTIQIINDDEQEPKVQFEQLMSRSHLPMFLRSNKEFMKNEDKKINT